MHNETFYTNKDINNIKIALLSDIHYYPGYNPKIINKIIKQITENKPNYITIVGDILDTSSTDNIEPLITFITHLATIAPVIVVKGNHDEKAGSLHNWIYKKNQKLIDELIKIPNLHYLDDNIYQDNNITFYGFNLSYNYYEKNDEDYNIFCDEVNKLKCNIPNNTYNITLFHSPVNIYRYLEEHPNHPLNKSDIILSGHMHNGCLPFIISHPINKIFKSSRGLISPTRALFPKYAQGHIYGKQEGYVYEGISKLSHSTKIFHKLDFLFQKNVEFIIIKNNK